MSYVQARALAVFNSCYDLPPPPPSPSVSSLELRVTIWQPICCDLGSGTMKNGRTLTTTTLLSFFLALVQARLDTPGEVFPLTFSF